MIKDEAGISGQVAVFGQSKMVNGLAVEPGISGQAAVFGQSTMVNGLAAEPKYCGRRKHNTKSKVPRQSKFGSQLLKVDPPNNCRYDSSLGMVRLQKL